MSLQHSAFLVATIFLACLSACADAKRESQPSSNNPGLGTHYVTRGTGEPVVLVHGFSQTHEAWLQTPIYKDLIRDYRVIAVDLRGHGDSHKPYDPQAYGQNLQADLVELLDHLEIDSAHFVGFSLGANVVGDLVVSSPGRVRTATMGSGFFTTWNEAEEDFAKLTEDRAVSGERYPWEPKNQDFQALAAVIRGARYSSVKPAQILAVTTPALMVFGSIEVEHMSVYQKQQLENLPSSIELLIVDGADHDGPNAAILSSEFSLAVKKLIASNLKK